MLHNRNFLSSKSKRLVYQIWSVYPLIGFTLRLFWITNATTYFLQNTPLFTFLGISHLAGLAVPVAQSSKGLVEQEHSAELDPSSPLKLDPEAFHVGHFILSSLQSLQKYAALVSCR